MVVQLPGAPGRWWHVTTRRLKPQQRYEHLLDTAAAMFAEKSSDGVMMRDIAAAAGVSRATVHHYFPTKKDINIALFKRASDRFRARVSTDPQLPLAEQLAIALQAHIQSFVEYPFEAVTIHRAALSDDPAIQAIVAEELNATAERLVDQLVTQGYSRDATEIAVWGWMAFVRAVCARWADTQTISRSALTGMCLRAFDCVLDVPAPTGRLRARMSRIVRRSASAISAPIPDTAIGHDITPPTASSAARSALAIGKSS